MDPGHWGDYRPQTPVLPLLTIGGFRDTYLGRQVVSRPGGPRSGMGSAVSCTGVWVSAASSPSGVWGGAPAEIEFGAFLALKSDTRWQRFL